MNITLHNAQQARQALDKLFEYAKPLLIAGRRVYVSAAERKSRDQERLYHSCFADLAKQCPFAGHKISAEDWKRLLLDAFYEATRDDPDFAPEWEGRRPRTIRSLDRQRWVLVGIESRGFTKKLASAFIEFVHATGDQRGVKWSRTSLGRDVPDEVAA